MAAVALLSFCYFIICPVWREIRYALHQHMSCLALSSQACMYSLLSYAISHGGRLSSLISSSVSDAAKALVTACDGPPCGDALQAMT